MKDLTGYSIQEFLYEFSNTDLTNQQFKITKPNNNHKHSSFNEILGIFQQLTKKGKASMTFYSNTKEAVEKCFWYGYPTIRINDSKGNMRYFLFKGDV